MNEEFESAATHLRSIISEVSEGDLLFLYGRYKQVTEGDCNVAKPLFWEFESKKKWTVWKGLYGMNHQQAQREYIDKIKSIDKNFCGESKKTSNTFSVKVSQPVQSKDDDDDDKNEYSNIFDYCKSGNLEQLTLQKNKINLNNLKDSQGQYLLHWACDRGSLDVVKFLVCECNCDINVQDNDLLTPLHYAVQCEHESIVKFLLRNGAKADIPGNDGETAIDCASKEMKRLLQNSIVN